MPEIAMAMTREEYSSAGNASLAGWRTLAPMTAYELADGAYAEVARAVGHDVVGLCFGAGEVEVCPADLFAAPGGPKGRPRGPWAGTRGRA